ncbi:MAG: CHAP domain-containing protein [Acidimicrobiales bacterium]
MGKGRFRALACGAFALSGAFAVGSAIASAPPASAQSMPGTTPGWCTSNGAQVVGWTGTSPNIPICGPAPNDGGSWQYVTLPGPYGSSGYFYNATTGFQCVELAERYLAVADGLAPVLANGQQVAANYHAAYSNTQLYVNGSRAAIGHPPVPGDVISFSDAPGFDAYDDGHVAVVSSSSVNEKTGNGTVTIAEENVNAGYQIYTLLLSRWHLFDPNSPSDALFGFPYAEWLHVTPYRVALGEAEMSIVNVQYVAGGIDPVQGIIGGMSGGFGRFVQRRAPAHRRFR